ncbi:MAG TPA: hypothetical protein VII06_15730 [Chloroflexota bacterium]
MFMEQVVGTEDAGLHWEALTPLVGPAMRGPSPTGLAFSNHEHGWMAMLNTMMGASLYVTDDGGRSWDPVPSFHPGDYPRLGLLRSRSQAHLALTFRRGQDYVLTTTDAGATWDFKYPSLAPMGPIHMFSVVDGIGAGVQAIHGVINEDTVAGDLDGGAILRTSDGGRTWARSTQIADGIVAFSFADSTHGWALAAPGSIGGRRIYSTEDGGLSWTLLPIAPAGSYEVFTSISRVSPSVGYAGTNRGDLFKIQAADSSSQLVTQGQERTFYTFTFVDEDRGWSIGNGELRETLDGGRTWIPRPLPKVISLLGANPRGRAWIMLGESMQSPLASELYSTTDNWQTWTHHEVTEPYFHPSAMPSWLDDQHGWWQLSPGHLYVTDDGGKTWRWPR